MKFFLDSAHVHEIEYALEMWNLDGVTTNPRHVQASGEKGSDPHSLPGCATMAT